MRFLYPVLLDELNAKSGSADYKNASPVMRRTLVLAVNEDLRECIPSVKASTLITWGKNDDAVPLSDAYFMEKAIADSAVVVFEKSGHFPFATEWQAFRAVMSSFLLID
jgi:pimeloyl-ACP methyl ester carboxylesterase